MIQPKKRLTDAINGILLLNKSLEISSNKALQNAKHLFNAKKAGHSGSLDPLATGMLPVCFGEATKICQYLLDADKCYETTGLLGIKTDTSDREGQITALVDTFDITEQELRDVLKGYVGDISQRPSMYSALKHKGKPLYRYAREGIEIERKTRIITIKEIHLTAFDGREFSLEVSCTKGTYIRNLIEDIGDTLAVGAHVTRLHRVYTSGFANMPMYTLEQLQEMTPEARIQCLIPMDEVVSYLTPIFLSDEALTSIRQGRIISVEKPYVKGECLRLYDQHSQFIGIGECMDSQTIKAKRLIAFDSQLINQRHSV